jgi:LAO/AO transport system kinase
MKPSELLAAIRSGDYKSLSRALSLVENDHPEASELLESLATSDTAVIGLTGPPGAGKSTLLDAILAHLVERGKKAAVIAVDPTSPFTHGALLGDRVRMSRHFDHPAVFIRSLATRGALGGLPAKCLEMCDVIREAGFDNVFIETVGVGQSEVEVAAVADKVAVILTPESGDEVQSMKAGLLEIADVFVVNKSDHPGADAFATHLEALASKRALRNSNVPVVKTVATTGTGVPELLNVLDAIEDGNPDRKAQLLTEKLYRIIQQRRMRDVDRAALLAAVLQSMRNGERTNLYRLAAGWSASD